MELECYWDMKLECYLDMKLECYWDRELECYWNRELECYWDENWNVIGIGNWNVIGMGKSKLNNSTWSLGLLAKRFRWPLLLNVPDKCLHLQMIFKSCRNLHLAS